MPATPTSPAPTSPAPTSPAPTSAVPWWAVVSGATAPVAMIGGWTVAAALQPEFDAVRGTISALAAAPATAPAVMTAGLGLTGLCHVVTALGLRPVPLAGRLLLAAGGVGTAAVAALPVTTWPQAHGVAAGVAFTALSVWPAAAWRRDGEGVLGRRVAALAAGVLTGTFGWFLLELQHVTPSDGALTGFAERVLAGAQSLWPLAVAVALRQGSRRLVEAAPGG